MNLREEDLPGYCPCCEELTGAGCDCTGKLCRLCGLCQRCCPIGDLWEDRGDGYTWPMRTHMLAGHVVPYLQKPSEEGG